MNPCSSRGRIEWRKGGGSSLADRKVSGRLAKRFGSDRATLFRLARRIAGVFLLAGLFSLPAGAQAATASSDLPSNDTCLMCHGDPTLSTTLGDGKTLSLYVNPDEFSKSVHGGKLACTDCHTDITTAPHEARQFKNRRAVALTYYQACKRCHFGEYSHLLDGIHYKMMAKGNEDAPTCVDCHGAHSITPPNQPRSRISHTCGRCHQAVEAAYVKSVHGRALMGQGNPDVPVCTDCHHSHNISNPLSTSWRLQIPQLCAHCHTDKKLMAKYGISTAVLTTYLADFHGMVASLYRSEKANPTELTATCTDCHGVHDITRVEGAGSRVIKANLLKTCQQCHPGATANFPSAWLGHYEPSLHHARLVYAVKVFYMILIPFMIGGLLLQILLHLWRVVVNR
jgi:predicted CXXCH cytochrome family protein